MPQPQIPQSRPQRHARRQQAHHRPVRRQLLLGPRRHAGAGALERRLAGQPRARARWPTRPASTSCCRSAAGRATAATPTTRAPPTRRSPGPAGLLASSKRITVFGTVHAPLFNPIIAAKMMMTADHIGQGRFGLNIVCGWNEDEFEMFGVIAARPRAPLRVRPGMVGRGAARLERQGELRLSRASTSTSRASAPSPSPTAARVPW